MEFSQTINDSEFLIMEAEYMALSDASREALARK